MTVHGALYVLDPYLLREMPVSLDRLVQRGEVLSVWDAQPGETYENWGCSWHISNPTVLRFVIEGVVARQVDWIVAPWSVPGIDEAERVIAKRLWRFDIDVILAEEALRLGRPVNQQYDVVVVDAERRARWVKRRAEDNSGMMWNKAAGDIPLNNPERVGG